MHPEKTNEAAHEPAAPALTEHHRRITALAQALGRLPGRRVKVHLIRKDGAPPMGINRIGGVPLGVPLSRWPDHRRWSDLDDPRQAHILSIDAAQLATPTPSGARALSLFVPTPSWLEDFNPVTLVPLTQEQLADAPAPNQPEDVEEDDRRRVRTVAPEGFTILPAIELPLAAFLDLPCDHAEYLERCREEDESLAGLSEEEADEFLRSESPLADLNQALLPRFRLDEAELAALGELGPALRSEPYIGGAPLWLQSHLHEHDFALVAKLAGEFFMQFGEELAGINCGDAGILYVTPSWSCWEFH